MEKYLDFAFEIKQNVIDAVKSIDNSKILTKMNNIREGNIPYFRLTVVGNENEINHYLTQLNEKLPLS